MDAGSVLAVAKRMSYRIFLGTNFRQLYMTIHISATSQTNTISATFSLGDEKPTHCNYQTMEK